MKFDCIRIVFMIFLSIIFHISCKKEVSCESCGDKNNPPIAVAGPDRAITLPTDSVLLDGSSSNDPDGRISDWLWTKISGPAPFNIIRSSDSITKVKTLVDGTYQFELKVTDNGGLSAKDTIQVIVDAVVTTNHPPIANAGADQTIILPTSTINLDGSASTDPDNNIATYAWTKISGPSSLNVVNTNVVQTQVTNLVQGVCQFELKVTDAGGLFSKDTMRVTVNAQQPPQPTTCEPLNRPVINAQLIPFGNLSIARSEMAVASAGDKLLFAGGANQSGLSSRVDIYDMTLQTWSTAELSLPRTAITAIASDNKILFAGGLGNQTPQSAYTSRVDIYDITTQIWSTFELSEARYNIAAAAVGNKVFFAGGDTYNGWHSNKVDIYDLYTNTWSTTTLSEAKGGMSATTAGDKIYFAGGDDGFGPTSTRIDIYDDATGLWSTSSLSSPKAYLASIFKNGKICWAGGATRIDLANEINITCQVEIKDLNTQTSSFTNLSHSQWYFGAYVKDNKIVYLPGFDIYDLSSNAWSIGQLNQSLPDAIISVNNTIYVAGGSNQVWKLEF